MIGVKAIIHPDPVRDRVLVYVQQGETGTTRFFLDRDSNSHEVQPGEEPPLFATIPNFIADAIGEALAPRPEASARHLDDAIELRDRLLTIVEAQGYADRECRLKEAERG